jgi:hypothetical protein
MLKLLTFIFVSALLLAGCGKDKRSPQANNPKDLTDLGVVELFLNTPKHLTLAEGQDCTVTAQSADQGKLQIKIEIKDAAPAATRIQNSKTLTATFPSGAEVMVPFDKERILRFKPVLKNP